MVRSLNTFVIGVPIYLRKFQCAKLDYLTRRAGVHKVLINLYTGGICFVLHYNIDKTLEAHFTNKRVALCYSVIK